MTFFRRHTESLYIASQAILLLGAAVIAAATTISADWHPLGLLALLLVFAVAGERFEIPLGGQSVSACFAALVLAMTLLGPAPAVAIAMVAIAVDSVARRPGFVVCLSNAATYATFTLIGSLVIRMATGDIQQAHHVSTQRGTTFVLILFGICVGLMFVNFVLIALQKRVLEGRKLIAQIRTVLIPMLPGVAAEAVLAAILPLAYIDLGYSALIGVALVIFVFQYLARALSRSEDRAEQLEARSVRLASMQLGMLATLVETLALRDRTTARHAAAVARHARALAREVGCDDAEQELVHTAGLLHDIGKFALPDRILHAEILSDDDWALVRRHPQDGATLVGRLDGYGPVADAILYHHEHVDGSGYPAGLIGNEIPLASRIVAVCSVYDTLTARDSYRSPMIPRDAIAELRRVAGRQLDQDIVDAFVAMLERDGPVTLAHGDDADFEAELDFERRARALAEPALR
jgi:putative nucleotidyltransferase with HDIG domain